MRNLGKKNIKNHTPKGVGKIHVYTTKIYLSVGNASSLIH